MTFLSNPTLSQPASTHPCLLASFLYDRFESIPEWSQTWSACKVLRRIEKHTDMIYWCTSDRVRQVSPGLGCQHCQHWVLVTCQHNGLFASVCLELLRRRQCLACLQPLMRAVRLASGT